MAQLDGVRAEIRALLDSNDGVVTRTQLAAAVPHHLIDRAISGGRLVRVLPKVYADAALLDRPRTHLLAALRYAGPLAAVSHTTSLSLWELPVPPGQPVHVITAVRQLTSTASLVIHRRRGLRTEPPWVVQRQGLPAIRLENALVDSWPLLEGSDRRAPLILAVQRRLTTALRVLEVAEPASRLSGRAALLELLDLLASGCHSELEIWGFRTVFDSPDLPVARRQLCVRLPGRRAYLDVAYERERVDVELDGSRYHFPTHLRERDMRRDVALSTLGWLVLRFSHRRLHEDPIGVRREVLATLETRRHQLALG